MSELLTFMQFLQLHAICDHNIPFVPHCNNMTSGPNLLYILYLTIQQDGLELVLHAKP